MDNEDRRTHIEAEPTEPSLGDLNRKARRRLEAELRRLKGLQFKDPKKWDAEFRRKARKK